MGKIVITGASSEIGLSITGKLAGLGKPMVLHCFKNSDTLERWRGVAEIVKADFSQREELDMFIAGLDDVEILVYASAAFFHRIRVHSCHCVASHGRHSSPHR